MPIQRLLWCLSLCLMLSAVVTPVHAEDKKDAQTVLNGMRLKKWTKDLGLTAEQQKKIQAILDQEYGQISKLNDDPAVGINERRDKVAEIHKDTYAKIKPLLDETQAEKFEKSVARPAPRKKP